MPNVSGKENRNSQKEGQKPKKFDQNEIDDYIARKTQEAIEQRIKNMLDGEEMLRVLMKDENNFKLLKDLERRLLETNKQLLEQHFDEDEEELPPNGNDAEQNLNDQDSQAYSCFILGYGLWLTLPKTQVLLTPFTKVTTGLDMLRRAKKYTKRGQYSRAIRSYKRGAS